MNRKTAFAVSPLLCLLALLAPPAPLAPAATPSYDAPHLYVRPGDFDFETLLGNPPAKDSSEHAAEVATVLAWQNRRTVEQINRCQREARGLNVWLFDTVLGDNFNATTHPLTAALFDEVAANAEPVAHAAKKHWKRPRPPVEDSQIVPCVHPERSASYPSGHATNAMVDALILAQIFPQQRDALIARGKQIGEDRVIAGIHWPSDVAAGQKLGTEIARRLLDNQDFLYELERASEECHGGPAAAGTPPTSLPTTQPEPAMP